MKIDILVLNYNGKELLEKFLPSIMEACSASWHKCNLYVIDNKSTDGSQQFIKRSFPKVSIINAKVNKVLFSYNEALKSLDSDIAILLNNDIKVKEDFIDYLIEHFNDPNVFFVAPKVLNFDNSFNGGKSTLHFNLGILKNIVDVNEYSVVSRTHSIACGAFRRDLFLKLGGFDDLYLPGIWEEVDLCYRAQLVGKIGIYEPQSIIWHQESTTFTKKYGTRRKLIFAHRNMFLFVWKNIRDYNLISQHLFFLPQWLLYSILSGKNELALGFWEALKKLPQAISRRIKENPIRATDSLKDGDIILH